jgi:hypothetical protein
MNILVSIAASVNDFTTGQLVALEESKDYWVAGSITKVSRTKVTFTANNGDVYNVDGPHLKSLKPISKKGKRTPYTKAEISPLFVKTKQNSNKLKEVSPKVLAKFCILWVDVFNGIQEGYKPRKVKVPEFPRKYRQGGSTLYRGLALTKELEEELKTKGTINYHSIYPMESWTHDLDIAKGFATQHGSKEGVIFSYTPKPEEVVADLAKFAEENAKAWEDDSVADYMDEYSDYGETTPSFLQHEKEVILKIKGIPKFEYAIDKSQKPITKGVVTDKAPTYVDSSGLILKQQPVKFSPAKYEKYLENGKWKSSVEHVKITQQSVTAYVSYFLDTEKDPKQLKATKKIKFILVRAPALDKFQATIPERGLYVVYANPKRCVSEDRDIFSEGPIKESFREAFLHELGHIIYADVKDTKEGLAFIQVVKDEAAKSRYISWYSEGMANGQTFHTAADIYDETFAECNRLTKEQGLKANNAIYNAYLKAKAKF